MKTQTTQKEITSTARNKKMTAMIDNKECPKCSSEKIECKDDKLRIQDKLQISLLKLI